MKRPAAAPSAEPIAKRKVAAGPVARPSFGVEMSRSRVQCRTGLSGPGQNVAISFKSAGGQDAAIEKAKEWVLQKCDEFGVEPPTYD